jgi:hypothetical protein
MRTITAAIAIAALAVPLRQVAGAVPSDTARRRGSAMS